MALVTRCFSISSRMLTGSNLGVMTRVWPRWSAKRVCAHGAEWYIGEVTRWISSPGRRSQISPRNQVASGMAASGSRPDNGRCTPLGNPVVPEVYHMTAPDDRPSGAVTGCPSASSETVTDCLASASAAVTGCPAVASERSRAVSRPVR